MFYEIAKYMRKLTKLCREELGKEISRTKCTISNYENEYSSPANDVLQDLADVLNTTTDYLLGRSNDPDLTARQERLIDKETEEILELLDQLPKDMKKHYLELFKAHTENSERARDKN